MHLYEARNSKNLGKKCRKVVQGYLEMHTDIHMIALMKSKSVHIECPTRSSNEQRRNLSRSPGRQTQGNWNIRSFIDLIVRNLTHLFEGSGRQHNLSFYENLHNSKQLEKLYTELIPLSF